MSVRWVIFCLFAGLIFAIAPDLVLAQEVEKPAPTTQTADVSVYDGKTIFPNRTQNADKPKTKPESTTMDLGRWTLSLAAVLGLILAMGFLSRKLMNPGSRGAADAMTVLARQNISPRQQLMLVQVGRRVVMVGNSAGQMNALAEITDPDEIADVMTRCNRRKKAAAEAFSDLFGKAEKDFTPSPQEEDVAKENADAADAQLLNTKAELSNLLEKVRSLSGKNPQNHPKDEK